MRTIPSIVTVVTLLSSVCLADKGLRFELNGKQQTVLPLDFSTQLVLAFKRNGELLELRPNEIKDPQVVPRFRPFSQAEARGELLREFGKGYEVTGTGNYLVVHPGGKGDLWANRFEELYRSMTHFFRARGYPMSKPQFPMIGIVFRSAAQYQSYSHRVLRTNAQNTYGVYMPKTNRIYLYDATQGAGAGSDEWQENLATVMHESAHQTAFNTGIHHRGAGSPRWVVEGLGCLFEARGIYDSLHFTDIADRINYGRLSSYHQSTSKDASTLFASIVASDKLFQRSPNRAYAVAWALTFYLSEREPGNYMRFLKRVAKHKPFERYSEARRMKDFTDIFGDNFRMLAVRVTRFTETLPAPKTAP